jgi:membrane protein DedA with SNARE-associated domain
MQEYILHVFAAATAGILDGIVEQISLWITIYGYPAVFAVAFLEMVFPPIPSEVIFPLVGFVAQNSGMGLDDAIGMAAVGAMGSTAGAILIYYISMKAGRQAIVRFGKRVRIGENEIEKAELWFQKYGLAAVFAARMVPGMREIISIPAGIGRMNIYKFVVVTFAGSFIWSVALTLVGYYVGEAWHDVADQISSVFSVVGVAIVIGLVALIAMIYFRKRKSKLAR